MPSDSEICNLALGHLGVSRAISALTDRTLDAMACRRVFTMARDIVLESFAWPFAKKQFKLALIREVTDGSERRRYAYQYPEDAITILGVVNPTIYNESVADRIPYEIFHGTSGAEIRTDQEDASILMVYRVEDTSRFSPSFVLALSYKIAELIAPTLTGGDPYRRGDACAQKYAQAISSTSAGAANEEQMEEPPLSDILRARDA